MSKLRSVFTSIYLVSNCQTLGKHWHMLSFRYWQRRLGFLMIILVEHLLYLVLLKSLVAVKGLRITSHHGWSIRLLLFFQEVLWLSGRNLGIRLSLGPLGGFLELVKILRSKAYLGATYGSEIFGTVHKVLVILRKHIYLALEYLIRP